MCARILVADDEENFLRLMARTLIKEGHEIRTAGDGEEALRYFEEENFDLALLDLQMPLMDGLTTLREIKRRAPQVKVIMITAFPSPETRRRALQEGAYDYLNKPIEISDLKETIRLALRPVDRGIQDD